MDISPLLTSTVGIERFAGLDGYGKSTYAPLITVAARVEGTWARAGGPGGAMTLMEGSLLTQVEVGPRDRLTLVGDPTPRFPGAGGISPEPDTEGVIVAYRTSL